MAEQEESIELKVLAFDIFGTEVERQPEAAPRLGFAHFPCAVSPTASPIPA
jgi:hypothetical protein